MKQENLDKFSQREQLLLEERYHELNETAGLLGYCCVRHQKFPVKQSIMTLNEYVPLCELKEDQIVAHGKEIYT